MQMKPVKKTQFAGLNNKRFYFHDGIASLPFRHFLLDRVREEKEKYQADLHIKIQKKKKKNVSGISENRPCLAVF